MTVTIVETRAEIRAITGGVDTHADVHVAAALDPIGGLLGVREFPATTAGYARLLGWLAGFGAVALVGIEGTGSYGAGLARHMAAAGVRVVEVDRIPFAEDYRLGADRSFLLTFTPGMVASLASLTLIHWPVAAHFLSATALLLLVFTIRSFVLFASQTAMLRLAVSRPRTPPDVEYPKFFLLGGTRKAEFIPFNILIQTNMILSLAIVAAIALAVIIVIGAFI